jgi:hypothetical protein
VCVPNQDQGSEMIYFESFFTIFKKKFQFLRYLGGGKSLLVPKKHFKNLTKLGLPKAVMVEGIKNILPPTPKSGALDFNYYYQDMLVIYVN